MSAWISCFGKPRVGALKAESLRINSSRKMQNGARAAGSKELPNERLCSGEQCLLFCFEVLASGWPVS